MMRTFETIEEEILILAAQAGDASAFEAILHRWLPIMRRHAARLTGDALEAEDVVQEACLALVGALSHLQDPARARGWMLRIVTHKATDSVRRRQRDRQLTRTLQNREPSSIISVLQSKSDANEQAMLIRKACMCLPADLCAVVSLFYGEGMPIVAIADGLGVPVGTIKSRLHAARAELKSLLERNVA